MKDLPTLQDIAAALGMHKGTVSQALSGKGTLSAATRERVLTAARELGYEPNPFAQRLAHGGSPHMVCLFSGYLDVGLATAKILLIQRELSARSLEVPIYTCTEPAPDSREHQAAQIKQLCRQRPRAILCATHRLHPIVYGELEAYQRAGGIVVSYDTPAPLHCDQVIFDRDDNAYRAARHLLLRGHRHLGILMSGTAPRSSDGGYMPQPFRLQGFRRAVAEFGARGEEWFFQNASYEMGGAEMAHRFLDLAPAERPTGLCIVNDYVALAFLVEIMRAGVRVPEEVSVVSHDNQPVALFCPVPLTSVSHPVEAITHTAVEMLMARMDGSDAPPRTATIQGELVQRRSVAAPPGGARELAPPGSALALAPRDDRR